MTGFQTADDFVDELVERLRGRVLSKEQVDRVDAALRLAWLGDPEETVPDHAGYVQREKPQGFVGIPGDEFLERAGEAVFARPDTLQSAEWAKEAENSLSRFFGTPPSLIIQRLLEEPFAAYAMDVAYDTRHRVAIEVSAMAVTGETPELMAQSALVRNQIAFSINPHGDEAK